MKPIDLQESDEDAPTVQVPGWKLGSLLDTPAPAAREIVAGPDEGSLEASVGPDAPPPAAEVVAPEEEENGRLWFAAAALALGTALLVGTYLSMS